MRCLRPSDNVEVVNVGAEVTVYESGLNLAADINPSSKKIPRKELTLGRE